MKKRNDQKEDTKALYLKTVNSPVYRKKIKTVNEKIKDYNRIVKNGSIKNKDVLDISKYFADDIRNPIAPNRNIVVEKPKDPAFEMPKGFLKIS